MVWLLEALGLRGAEREEEVCTIYIGDDVTDEDAFHALVRLLWGGWWFDCVIRMGGWVEGWDRPTPNNKLTLTVRTPIHCLAKNKKNRWRRRRAARGGWRGSGSW